MNKLLTVLTFLSICSSTIAQTVPTSNVFQSCVETLSSKLIDIDKIEAATGTLAGCPNAIVGDSNAFIIYNLYRKSKVDNSCMYVESAQGHFIKCFKH